YFLNKIQQPGNVHEAEQGGGNGQNAGGVAAGEELPKTEPQHKEDEETRFKIVYTGGRTGGADKDGLIQKRFAHEEESAQQPPPLEANQFALFDEAIKLGEAGHGEDDHDQEEDVIR